MEGFPSGQREQTVNLSSMTSVVRIHHLPPKQKDIPKGMSFFCFGGRWLWIRKVALRNSPVGCFNHRGLPVGRQPLKYLMVVPAAKRIHHRTGRHACSSATMGGNNQSRQARARSEGKNRLCSIAKSTCTGVCNDILPFATLSRRGAHTHRSGRPASNRRRRLLASRSVRPPYQSTTTCNLGEHRSPYGIYGATPCLSTNKRSGFIT